MAGSKKNNKSQKGKSDTEVKTNGFAVLTDADGNPSTPLEHDEAPGYEDEKFFKAEDDADDDAKKRVFILNFIHQELKHATERKVPVLDDEKDFADVEVYHRVTFEGVELDVCVYWPPHVEGDFKSCVAIVKYTKDDPAAEKAVDGLVATDAAWNADSKADTFTLKNDKLVKNYWAPRWKYVVNALKNTAYFRYKKNGDQKPFEPEPAAEAEDAYGGDMESQEKEEPMKVPAGSTGKIIGPKGAKIQEIKAASKVTDINMPLKIDGPDRPRARDLVSVTLVGKARAIAKAREMIQVVVDEWRNTPRTLYVAQEVPQYDAGDDKIGGGYTGESVAAEGNWGSGGGEATVEVTQNGGW